MAKTAVKERTFERVVDTPEGKALVKKAQEGLRKARTKDDVIAVWKECYGKLGHKNMGRLLLFGTTERQASTKAATKK